MLKMEDADMGKEYGVLSNKTSRSTTGESMTEDIDMDDYYGGYGSYRMMVFWNLEDFPIPQSAELGSIGPRIWKALALLGFRGCVKINGYAEHLNYDVDKLCKAGINRCSPSMRPAYMPQGMIVHAHSTTRNREQVILFVIANQIPGSQLVRVQECLKSRGCTVIFVEDPSKQCLFHSAESIFDCTRFVGAEQRVSRSGLNFFSGEKPIGTKRSERLLDEVTQVLKGGGYSEEYASYVSNLCQVATGKKLILDDIIGCIRSISPIDDDLFGIIHKVLCERGFRLNFFDAEDTTKGRSPGDCVDLPPLVVEPATCDSHSDSISHSRKIENFSEPITPVETVLFWDVVDCPFPPHCPPDEIYDIIGKAVLEGGYGGEMTIWAYVDENNGPWTGEYLRNKTWNSRIYFLPGGDDKASRLLRMLNDVYLWKMDMVSAACDVDSDYTAFVDVFVVSYQVRGDAEFSSLLMDMSSLYFIEPFLITPTQFVNKPGPESLELPGLLFEKVVSFLSASSDSSESSPSPSPSPKRQEADDAAEETP